MVKIQMDSHRSNIEDQTTHQYLHFYLERKLDNHASFANPNWSGPNLNRITVRTKFGFVNGIQNLVKTIRGPAPELMS